MNSKPIRRERVKPVAGNCRWVRRLTLPDGLGRIDINGAGYDVEAVLDGGRVVGLRLVKDDDTAYHVDTSGADWTCDCPDAVYRDRQCKHSKSLRAALAAAGQHVDRRRGRVKTDGSEGGKGGRRFYVPGRGRAADAGRRWRLDHDDDDDGGRAGAADVRRAAGGLRGVVPAAGTWARSPTGGRRWRRAGGRPAGTRGCWRTWRSTGCRGSPPGGRAGRSSPVAAARPGRVSPAGAASHTGRAER